MACLGGRVELSLLQTATAAPAGVVEQALAPALDEGLLVVEPGAREAVRFRHDRLREAILAGLDPPRRRTLQLAMARRLAEVPELFAVAAEQYLPVADAVDDPAERASGGGAAAARRRPGGVDRGLRAGERAAGGGAAADRPGRDRHAGRGAHRPARRPVQHRAPGGGRRGVPHDRPAVPHRPAARGRDGVQVRSLTHRNRFAEAIGLGLDSLRELGITVPAADRLAAELDRQFDYLYRWLDHTDAADDLARPEITDPALLAATRLINAVLPAAYFVADLSTHAWLSLEALRIWLEHGPGRTLLGPASHAAFAAVGCAATTPPGTGRCGGSWRWARPAATSPTPRRRASVFAVLSCWFEPIEDVVHAAQRAREGLIAGGDLANAGYTYYPTVYYLLDCAPSLDGCVAEVEAGLAFVRRTGSEQTGQWLDSYRWLAGVLRGESSAAAGEAAPSTGTPTTRWRSSTRTSPARSPPPSSAIRSAWRGTPRRRCRCCRPPPGLYPTAVARLLRGLALAGQARASHGDQRGALLSELDEVTRWLAARAADAPDNFLHLLRLLEAERAWAVGDFRAAALAFDAARREVAQRQRPWHRALITERAARFYLGPRPRPRRLRPARPGPPAVRRLGRDREGRPTRLGLPHPATTTRPDRRPHDDRQPDAVRSDRAAVTTGTLDLLGILSASQALSSQTSIDRLHARVVEVLGAMTGATGVHLLLWSEDRHDWLLPAPAGGTAPVSGTGHETRAADVGAALRPADR